MRNTIIRIITLISAFAMMLSMCALESPSKTIPIIIFIVSLGWLLLFMLANKDATIEQILGKWGRD
jgi:hypothetical protein